MPGIVHTIQAFAIAASRGVVVIVVVVVVYSIGCAEQMSM